MPPVPNTTTRRSSGRTATALRMARPSMKQRCPVGGGYSTTLTASGMTGHGHSSGEPNIRLSGTVRPWSTSILLTMVRSNSSRMTDCAMCEASCGMALDHRHRARAPAFVGRRKLGGAAEREGRDHLERERRGVIVVDHDDDVGLGLRHPLLGLARSRRTPRFQYGSSVFLLSIAAPMAGTCEDATPAMILATFRSCLVGRFVFCWNVSARLWLGLRAGVRGLASASDLLRLPSTERPPSSIISA